MNKINSKVEFHAFGVFVDMGGDDMEILQGWSPYEFIQVLIANPQIDITEGRWFVITKTA